MMREICQGCWVFLTCEIQIFDRCLHSAEASKSKATNARFADENADAERAALIRSVVDDDGRERWLNNDDLVVLALEFATRTEPDSWT